MATPHRPITKLLGSASLWNIPSDPSAPPHRLILILYTFWFLSNRPPFLHQITFFDTCQKIVSTHVPQFWSNLFCSKTILTHNYFFVPMLPEQILESCAHGTLQYSQVKLFFPLTFRFRSTQTSRDDSLSIFSPPRFVHKYYPSARHRQQVSISYSTSSFLLSLAQKP